MTLPAISISLSVSVNTMSMSGISHRIGLEIWDSGRNTEMHLERQPIM